ncbi:MAG: lysylphosphatidylglycerol synthase domain-containing protein [Actinomycetota bacterium]
MVDVPSNVNALISDPPKTPRRRELLSGAVLVLVLVAVTVVVARNWTAFIDSIHKIGVVGVALSLTAAMVGVFGSYLSWRSVLIGLGVRFGFLEGAHVFFVSQLGKYLPGSVWPIVMQMEAGRRRGANRKTMLAANLVTVLLGVCVGVVLAGLFLPFSSPAALHRFWWALAALPLLLVLAHPRSLPFLLNVALKILRREPMDMQMTNKATMAAAGWSTLSWVGLGTHLAVLAAAVGKPSLGLLTLCIGGMALAVSAGLLFLPAPAGAGMREIALGYVLVAALTSGQVLAVVVASRVILLLADLLLAGVFSLIGRSEEVTS